jgi:hypothetical protein
MNKKTLKERLDLIAEARLKIEKMKMGSAFVTDFQACRLLEKLLEGYQDLMADNLKLEKHKKFHAAAQKIKSKRLDPKKSGS